MPLIRENVPLKDFSNYKIGGPARFFADPASVEELQTLLRERDRALPLFILGGGTNLLISDEGFPGLVIHPKIAGIAINEASITVLAGTLVKDVIDTAIVAGLEGLEWAGGLPGEVGGAIRGNAGAFRGEIKDAVSIVESIAIETGELKKYTNGECGFGYRTSRFKESGGREIIISADFLLRPGDAKKLRAIADDHIRYRSERHPMNYPNIGSIFKNCDVRAVPESVRTVAAHVIKKDPFPVIPTAFLLAEAGLKGTRQGDALISEKHPNFVINTGAATARDVKILIELMKKTVHDRYGIFLEEEIQYV